MIADLTPDEIKALAMHEIMEREQKKMRSRIDSQRHISLLSDESLQELVYGKKSVKAES